MSYRCEVCDRPQKPGTPKKRHCILRPDKSIKQELAVCSSCLKFLEQGESIEKVRARVGPKRPKPLALVVNRPVTLG